MRCPSLNELPPPPPAKPCAPGGSGVIQRGWPWTEQSSQLPETMPHGNPWPKISIVTPSYNQGQFIEETIRSVLLQGYPNFEYIIIDGDSTDHSVEIIKKYEKWLSYWISEPDKGQSDAINKGLKRCTGEIFNWLNSDDYLELGAFHVIGNSFYKYPQKNVLVGKSKVFYENDKSNNKIVHSTTIKKTIEETLFIAQIGQTATFWGNNVFNEIGPLVNDLHYHMDAEWWIRYLLRYGQKNIIKISHIIANCRTHDLCKMMNRNQATQEEQTMLLYNKAKITNTSEYVLNQIERIFYPSHKIMINWSVTTAINSNKMAALYYRLFACKFYSYYKYREAKNEFFQYIKNGAPCLNKVTLGLIIKTFFIPKFLLNFLRKFKHNFFNKKP